MSKKKHTFKWPEPNQKLRECSEREWDDEWVELQKRPLSLAHCWRWRKTSLWPFYFACFFIACLVFFLCIAISFLCRAKSFVRLLHATQAWNAKNIHADAIKTFIIIITIAIFKCFMFALQIFPHSFRMCVHCSVFSFVCFGMFHIFHARTRWSGHSGYIVISLSRHATHNTISIYLFMSSLFVFHYQINIEIFHISLYQVAIFHHSWAPLLVRLISGCKTVCYFIFV